MKKIVFCFILLHGLTAFAQNNVTLTGNFTPFNDENRNSEIKFSVYIDIINTQLIAKDSIDSNGDFKVNFHLSKAQPVFWTVKSISGGEVLSGRMLWLDVGKIQVDLYQVFSTSARGFVTSIFNTYCEGSYETENRFLEKLYKADQFFPKRFGQFLPLLTVPTSLETQFQAIDSIQQRLQNELEKISRLKLSPGFMAFATTETENFVLANKSAFLLLISIAQNYLQKDSIQVVQKPVTESELNSRMNELLNKLLSKPFSYFTASPSYRAAWLSYLYYEWLNKISNNGATQVTDFNIQQVSILRKLIQEKFVGKSVLQETLSALILDNSIEINFKEEEKASVFQQAIAGFRQDFPASKYINILQKKFEKQLEAIRQLKKEAVSDSLTAMPEQQTDSMAVDSMGSEIGENIFLTEKTAPDYGLTDAKGKLFSLASLRGNVVCVFVWDEYSEENVRQLAYTKWLETEIKGKPVKILILNTSAEAFSLQTVVKRLKLKSPVLTISDKYEGKKFAEQYSEVYEEGFNFLIDRAGKIWQHNNEQEIAKAIEYLLGQ